MNHGNAAPQPIPSPRDEAAEALQNVRSAVDTRSAQAHIEATTGFFARRLTAHLSPIEMRQRREKEGQS